MVGWGVFTDLLVGILPVVAIDFLANLGFMPHFISLSRGLIDSRDLVYFVSLIVIFLALTSSSSKPARQHNEESAFNRQKYFSPDRRHGVYQYHFRTTVFSFRYYCGKLFSLSTGTISLLEKLSSEIRIKYYFTRHIAEVPVPVKTYASRVEELLREYVARSGGKLSFNIYDPKPDTDDEEWAHKYGIKAARLSTGKAMFFGCGFQQRNTRNRYPLPRSAARRFSGIRSI